VSEFAADALPELVAGHSRVSISGPELAAQALRAGLVDELHLYVLPVTVGAGTPMLPAGVRLDLELLTERGFAGGAVHLGYAVRNSRTGNRQA
jgi:dihydrofolate reductase